MRSRGRRVRVELDAKREHQSLVVCERHAVCLLCVALDFGDEPVLVFGTGLEPAIALELKHLVHDSSRRG